MRALIFTILLLAFVAAVYADEPQKVIDVQHDSVRGATCWILNDSAISCLPDSQLRQPSSVSNSTSGGAKPASAHGPRRVHEVFQL